MEYVDVEDINKIVVGFDGCKLFCIIKLKNDKLGKDDYKLSKEAICYIINKIVDFLFKLVNEDIDVYTYDEGILLEFPKLSKDTNICKEYQT